MSDEFEYVLSQEPTIDECIGCVGDAAYSAEQFNRYVKGWKLESNPSFYSGEIVTELEHAVEKLNEFKLNVESSRY